MMDFRSQLAKVFLSREIFPQSFGHGSKSSNYPQEFPSKLKLARSVVHDMLFSRD